MAHATFAKLPPEIVGSVFAFIRSKSDQSTVCLVSRACRDVMVSKMWEVLEIKLSTASPSSLATLVHPRSGITKHIREIKVLDSGVPYFDASSEIEDRLKSLILAIPQDRLRALTCYVHLSTPTVQLLLQSQQKIETLEVSTPFTISGLPGLPDSTFEEHYAWSTSSLSHVAEMLLYLDPIGVSEERIFEGIHFLSKNHSKIRDLLLYSLASTKTDVISLCRILRHAKELPLFSNLTSLRLFNLKLAKRGEPAISNSLDLSKLSCLQLQGCDDIVPFMESLSSFYARGIGELKWLYIILPDQIKDPQNSVKAIEALLKVCSKLIELQLELSGHGFVAKDCILAHCQKLQCLSIGTGGSQSRYFSVVEMTAILRACIHLKYLAVNMPAVDLGSIIELGTGFYPEGEFADMLAALSINPTLHAFRILNLPTVNLNEDGATVPGKTQVYFCQILMQNFANKIFRFMANRGSNLRVLAIRPSSKNVRDAGKDLGIDANGHQWPDYHYARGRLTEVTGMNGVVAHPLRNVLQDFPDLVSLFN